MPITKAEAQTILDDFKKEFKGLSDTGAAKLTYYLFDTQQDFENVYGKGPNTTQAIANWGTAKGGFSRSTLSAAFYVRNMHDKDEFAATLRHESLGHSGLNTYTSDEKRALIAAVALTRNEPTLVPYWQNVDIHYPTLSESEKAEEVFCWVSELATPNRSPGLVPVAFNHVWQNSVLNQNEVMQKWGICQVAEKLADGFRNDTLKHQIVPPHDGIQFRLGEGLQHERNPAVLDKAAQAALPEHLEILQTDTRFSQRSTDELSTLAYWRGIVCEDKKYSPLDELKATLERFDTRACQPDFLAHLPSAEKASPVERVMVRDEGMSL